VDPTLILGESQIRRTLKRLACEIVERNRGLRNVVIVGIKTRGVSVAEEIARAIEETSAEQVPVYALDASGFRDDGKGGDAVVPDFEVAGRDVVLVDDVLYTGRTIRAALDALVQAGRPSSIQLAVLVDRGHREYPIRPDYVGRIIETAYREHVVVEVRPKMAIRLVES
jgi:pyrimidine operon attenuation protein / uracil phosphoribosyltransferase